MGLNLIAKEAIDYCNYFCVMNCILINLSDTESRQINKECYTFYRRGCWLLYKAETEPDIQPTQTSKQLLFRSNSGGFFFFLPIYLFIFSLSTHSFIYLFCSELSFQDRMGDNILTQLTIQRHESHFQETNTAALNIMQFT